MSKWSIALFVESLSQTLKLPESIAKNALKK